MTVPVSDLVVCRQRLDLLEQQAKAATDAEWEWGWLNTGDSATETYTVRRAAPACEVLARTSRYKQGWEDAVHIAAWSPIAVLAWVAWIRRTLDGAEEADQRHQSAQVGGYCRFCGYDMPWPCPDYTTAESVIAGLAAVLAPTAEGAVR